MKDSRSFLKRFKLLEEVDILNENGFEAEVARIRNQEKIFSIGCFIKNSRNRGKYFLYYITGRFGLLEGCMLELDRNLTWKSRFSLVGEFSLHLYHRFSVDSPKIILNTLEACQRTAFAKIGIDFETNVFGGEFVFNPSRMDLVDRGCSFVYLMRNNSNGLYKIGRSTQPYKRESTLQSQEPDISMISIRRGSYNVETALHRKYKDVRKRGEWFDLSVQDVFEIEKFIIGFEQS